MTTNNLHAAMYQAHLLYDVSFNNEEDFEEIALIAHGMIGNKRVRLYKFSAVVDQHDLSIDLPCNCDIIEAVTLDHLEDYNYTSGTNPNGNIATAFVEQYIESRKAFTDPLYVHGKYLHYERSGQKLYFDKPYGLVTVLYKGEQLDEDGLPFVNDKEVKAIALFVSYVQKQKQGIRTNNKNLIEVANMLKRDWLIACDQARTPEDISQNEMNDILDAKSSWARKSYGASYKPMIK